MQSCPAEVASRNSGRSRRIPTPFSRRFGFHHQLARAQWQRTSRRDRPEIFQTPGAFRMQQAQKIVYGSFFSQNALRNSFSILVRSSSWPVSISGETCWISNRLDCNDYPLINISGGMLKLLAELFIVCNTSFLLITANKDCRLKGFMPV